MIRKKGIIEMALTMSTIKTSSGEVLNVVYDRTVVSHEREFTRFKLLNNDGHFFWEIYENSNQTICIVGDIEYSMVYSLIESGNNIISLFPKSEGGQFLRYEFLNESDERTK